MAFRFRLQPVLRLRQRVEDERALTLATAVRSRDATAGRLGHLKRETAAGRAALLAAGAHGTTGADLRALAASVTVAWRGTCAAADRLVAEESRVVEARAAVTDAARDRRALERLEAIQRGAHAARLRHHEQRQLDDLAAIYHRRRHAGPERDARP